MGRLPGARSAILSRSLTVLVTGNPKFSPPAGASGSGLAPSSLILGRILGSGPPLQVWDQVLEEFGTALGKVRRTPYNALSVGG